jgi:hypothetical protein
MKRALSKLTAVRSARRLAPPPLRALRPANSFISRPPIRFAALMPPIARAPPPVSVACQPKTTPDNPENDPFFLSVKISHGGLGV